MKEVTETLCDIVHRVAFRECTQPSDTEKWLKAFKDVQGAILHSDVISHEVRMKLEVLKEEFE